MNKDQIYKFPTFILIGIIDSSVTNSLFFKSNVIESITTWNFRAYRSIKKNLCYNLRLCSKDTSVKILVSIINKYL